MRGGRTWGRRGEGLCHGGLPTLSKGNWSDPWEVTHPTYNPHMTLSTHFAFALGVSVQEELGPGCPELGGACLAWLPQEAFQIPQNYMNCISPQDGAEDALENLHRTLCLLQRWQSEGEVEAVILVEGGWRESWAQEPQGGVDGRCWTEPKSTGRRKMTGGPWGPSHTPEGCWEQEAW